MARRLARTAALRLRALGATDVGVLARRVGTRANGHRLLIVVVALVGAILGMRLAGGVTAPIGPVQTHMQLVPAWSGESVLEIPPLGTLQLDTHNAPIRIDATVTQLDTAAAQRIVEDPSLLKGLEGRVEHDLKIALLKLVVRSAIVALLGGAILTALVTRRSRAVLAGIAAVAVAFAGTGVATYGTWNSKALAEPTYTGLLTRAPEVVGDVQDIVSRFGHYSEQLARLVTNVSRLYGVTSTLPTFNPSANTIKVLHVSDIHLNPEAWPVIRSIVQQFDVDFIVDTGDLTDHGSTAENAFVDSIATLGVPYVFIKGNHDSPSTVAAVAAQPNAHVLDHDTVTIDGLRIYGVPDPRYTPDQSTSQSANSEKAVATYGKQAAANLASLEPPPVDIAMVHDPVTGEQLDGLTPLVLAGHLHHRAVEKLKAGTLMLVEGSTGGAGLRALDHSEPTPVEASILYFDGVDHRLAAYDNITLGGLGLASVTIDRHVITAPLEPVKPTTSPAPPTASPWLTPTATPWPVPVPTVGPSPTPRPPP